MDGQERSDLQQRQETALGCLVKSKYQKQIEAIIDDQVYEVGVFLNRGQSNQIQQDLAGRLLGNHQRSSFDHGYERLNQEVVLFVVRSILEAEVIDVAPAFGA